MMIACDCAILRLLHTFKRQAHINYTLDSILFSCPGWNTALFSLGRELLPTELYTSRVAQQPGLKVYYRMHKHTRKAKENPKD
jgi:hypothetical protein